MPPISRHFRAVLETNVLGIVHTFQPFVAGMMAARRGTLVGIASVAGFRGLPGAGAYSASKAAAINYLESLRVELVGSGVEVITICPGFIATPMTANNPYRMPFLLPPDKAARLIAGAIARRRRLYVLPWQMAWLGRALRVLPRPVYDRVLAKRPRKPRATSSLNRCRTTARGATRSASCTRSPGPTRASSAWCRA